MRIKVCVSCFSFHPFKSGLTFLKTDYTNMRIFKLSSLLAVAMVAAVLLLTGCVAKPKLDLNGVQDDPLGKGGLNGGADETGLYGPGYVAGPEGMDPDEFNGLNGWDDPDGLGAGKWGDTNAPVSEVGGSGFLKNERRWTDCVVYFAYDQYEVGPSERAKLDTLAQYLAENPGLGVVVEGHTDERGSDEYNRALGERRALAVTQYLSLMGVGANRCKTISYGEDKPAVPGAVSESDHQLNRRAEFLIGEL